MVHQVSRSQITATTYKLLWHVHCTIHIMLIFHKCQNRPLIQGSCPFAKIKLKDFSRTFKDHTKDIQRELNKIKPALLQAHISVVSSPSGVWGEALAENGFYAHLRSERNHLEHLFQYQLVRSQRFRQESLANANVKRATAVHV